MVKKIKTGFSLAEAIVVMGILSLFFAAATRVITVRPEDPIETKPHGYYECKFANNSYQQKYVRNHIEENSIGVNQCIFEPPIGVSLFAIYGLGYGKVNELFAEYLNGTWFTDFETVIDQNINITYQNDKWILTNDDNSNNIEYNNINDDNDKQIILNTIEKTLPDIYALLKQEANNTGEEQNINRLVISW